MDGDVRSSSSDEISDSSENAKPLTNGTPKKKHLSSNNATPASPKKATPSSPKK
jgi:sphingoid base N-palmitoyltransferase